jgi:hypothetical protein
MVGIDARCDGWFVMDARVLFCDFAEVSGGKLFISGAGISLVAAVQPTPPFPLTAALAILVTVPTSETDRPHRLTVELLARAGDGSEQRVPMTGPGPDVLPGEEGLIVHPFAIERGPNIIDGDDICVPLALPLSQFPLPQMGGYTFSVHIDEVEMDRAGFRLVPLPQPEASE